MAERHSGLTKPIADSYTEAACVCLDRFHSSPQKIVIRNETDIKEAKAQWDTTDELTRGAWANEVDATEAGAYAFALAAVELTEGLYAVRRAETRTGADYYIAPYGKGIEDLEECLRLEVSGVAAGGERDVKRRFKEKTEQATRGKSNLPAMAAVVGFKISLILLMNVK
ncbi:MAG: hypothetical protein HQL06_07155 [Nitrospirae bacterium]|nr:hypothetical protein [Nitrospirota bacterium]